MQGYNRLRMLIWGVRMIVRNEDVKELVLEVPEGHTHLRTSLVLHDGSEMVLQEATVANLVRAYVTLKTHPCKKSVRLKGKRVDQRKEGYAEWQLLEAEDKGETV
jgi:hypothetical protein